MSGHNADIDLRNKDQIIQDSLTDLQLLQKNLTCLICLSLMTLPFVLSCSHTFCYGCSFEWLSSHKTCPTCRHAVRQQPVMCHPMKEMCNILIERQCLLSPSGEGLLLRERQKEQADLLGRHQPNLFPGLFRQGISLHGGRLLDTEEHVMRCIRCHWEIEGPECTHCGYAFSDDDNISDNVFYDNTGFDLEDLDVDISSGSNEYDLDDSFIDEGGVSDIDSQQEEEDYFSDYAEESQNSVEDVGLIAEDSPEDSTSRRFGRRLPNHIVISSDDDNDNDESAQGDCVLEDGTYEVDVDPDREDEHDDLSLQDAFRAGSAHGVEHISCASMDDAEASGLMEHDSAEFHEFDEEDVEHEDGSEESLSLHSQSRICSRQNTRRVNRIYVDSDEE